jgi:general secretion pathway protein G
MKKGFTLVEIIIVLALIGILVAIVVPIYRNSVIRAREAVLKENLFHIRDAISKYYYDKQKYPTTLEDLVTEKYLSKIPLDTILNTDDWELIHFEPLDMEDFDPEIAEGIIDVKSRSESMALDGTSYADW